jgi:hypothetical protein
MCDLVIGCPVQMWLHSPPVLNSPLNIATVIGKKLYDINETPLGNDRIVIGSRDHPGGNTAGF